MSKKWSNSAKAAMGAESPNELKHKLITEKIHELYKVKNAQYGDSFHKLYEDLGIISGATQIAHKYNRLIEILKKNTDLNDEDNKRRIVDTLYDLANYSVLLLLEVDDIDLGPIFDDTEPDKDAKDVEYKFGDDKYGPIQILPQEEVETLINDLSTGYYPEER